MKFLLPLFLVFFVSCASSSKKLVNYTVDGKTFNGYIATPKNVEGKKPGILVVHEWWGQNDYARMRADMLADEGYVAMAVDMYGDGKTVESPEDAGKLAGEVYSHPTYAKDRLAKALEVLKSHPNVDASKTAAIGYCFGGAMVLIMAREGMDLDGVISYHGNLKPTYGKAKKGKVKARVLNFNGAADPFVPKAEVDAFKKEMKAAGVKYTNIDYKGALHAFTNPESDATAKKWKLPVAYDEKADKDSWKRSLEFFKTIF